MSYPSVYGGGGGGTTAGRAPPLYANPPMPAYPTHHAAAASAAPQYHHTPPPAGPLPPRRGSGSGSGGGSASGTKAMKLMKFRRACQLGNVHVVRELVEVEGVEIDTPQDDGCTGLWLASEAGHVDTAEYLCRIGASTAAVKTQGGVSCLYVASQNGHFDVVATLLRHGADPNTSKDSGATPLFISSQQNNQTIVSMLLDAGAHPDAATRAGVTPLMIAAYQGNAAVIRQLVAFGADPYLRGSGKTAAEWAESNNTLHLVDEVLHGPRIADTGVHTVPPPAEPPRHTAGPPVPPTPPSRSTVSRTPQAAPPPPGRAQREASASGSVTAPPPIHVVQPPWGPGGAAKPPPAAPHAAAASHPVRVLDRRRSPSPDAAVYESQRHDASGFSDGLEAVDSASFAPSKAYASAEMSLANLFRIKDQPIELHSAVERELSRSRSRSRSCSPAPSQRGGRAPRGSSARRSARQGSASPAPSRGGGGGAPRSTPGDPLASLSSNEPEFLRRERQNAKRFKEGTRQEALRKKASRPGSFFGDHLKGGGREVDRMWDDHKYRLSTMENELVRTRYDVADKWMFSKGELERRGEQLRAEETSFDRDVGQGFAAGSAVSPEVSPARRQREADEMSRRVIHPSAIPLEPNMRRVEHLAHVMGVSNVEGVQRRVTELAHFASVAPPQGGNDSIVSVQKQLDLSGLSQGTALGATVADEAMALTTAGNSNTALLSAPPTAPDPVLDLGVAAGQTVPSLGSSRRSSVVEGAPRGVPSEVGGGGGGSGGASSSSLADTLKKLEEDGEYGQGVG